MLWCPSFKTVGTLLPIAFSCNAAGALAGCVSWCFALLKHLFWLLLYEYLNNANMEIAPWQRIYRRDFTLSACFVLHIQKDLCRAYSIFKKSKQPVYYYSCLCLSNLCWHKHIISTMVFSKSYFCGIYSVIITFLECIQILFWQMQINLHISQLRKWETKKENVVLGKVRILLKCLFAIDLW